MIEYFCTECEREVDAEHVHIDYGFKVIYKYKPTRKLYNRKECIIRNKHLCMCQKCWNNLANEYMLYSANAMERKKNKNF